MEQLCFKCKNLIDLTPQEMVPRPWPSLRRVLSSLSPALGLRQSLPIFLCYSWSIYSSCSGELSPPSLSLPLSSLSLTLSVCRFFSLWSPLGLCSREGTNVGLLTHRSMFLLWECSVRSVSFRGAPSLLHATPYPPPWADIFQSG